MIVDEKFVIEAYFRHYFKVSREEIWLIFVSHFLFHCMSTIYSFFLLFATYFINAIIFIQIYVVYYCRHCRNLFPFYFFYFMFYFNVFYLSILLKIQILNVDYDVDQAKKKVIFHVC